ncbi:hypothetical protein ANTRET_LOCUS9261 [Anthophora retusa]
MSGGRNDVAKDLNRSLPRTTQFHVVRGNRGGRKDVQTESGSAWAQNRAPGSLVDILPLPGLRHYPWLMHEENTLCPDSGRRCCAIDRPLSQDPPRRGRLRRRLRRCTYNQVST